ncbi:LPXTG cell wall anchor domain-containing protein [uncultured Vagococcus sp.]|uniref:LPXTG cell wall anchor domain-containing protein n=1 Tax=uncultured Vagococcus sp. TaxID=189676 RepID=UPI0028D0EBF2|nr:LPXTG cell wall anchor domain-containing protein [uncultured Vagococcus sp.]
MKIINKSLTFCLVVLICGILPHSSVLAAESGGGQVSSNSKITFYSDEPKKEEPKPTPTPKPTPKPGILPQTGEAVKNFSLAGITLLSITVILFLRKRRKEYEK